MFGPGSALHAATGRDLPAQRTTHPMPLAHHKGAGLLFAGIRRTISTPSPPGIKNYPLRVLLFVEDLVSFDIDLGDQNLFEVIDHLLHGLVPG